MEKKVYNKQRQQVERDLTEMRKTSKVVRIDLGMLNFHKGAEIDLSNSLWHVKM